MSFKRSSVFLLLSTCGLTMGQEPVPGMLQVNEARPMKAVIDNLQRTTGIPVNYEDPRFEYSGDIQDVTDQVQSPAQKAAHPNVRIIVPKGGPLALDLTTASLKPGVGDVLSLILQAKGQHESKGYPGRFSITQTGNTLTVKPSAVLSASGTWKNAAAVMDTHISMPTKTRSGSEALIAFADALTKAQGIKIGIGRVPFVAFENAQTTVGASDEPAGTVLGRIFDQLSQYYRASVANVPYSYSLLYDPGLKYYLLHVNALPQALPAAEPILNSLPVSGSPYLRKGSK
jgi:hypothetical protein